MDVGRFVAKALPRVLWATALVLLLVWLMECQGALTLDLKNAVSLIQFHYFFMFLAWPVFMVEAILSYRAPLITLHSRRAVKYLHATLQSLVGAFIILGLVFIEEFKTRSHEVHFFSLHSWIGIVSIALYFGQYISGFSIYLLSKWEPGRKADFFPVHRFLGASSLLSGFLSILLGLMEDQTFGLFTSGGISNFFKPAKAHAFPYAILSGLGLVLFLLAISVMFTFVAFKEQAVPAPASNKEGALPDAAYPNGAYVNGAAAA